MQAAATPAANDAAPGSAVLHLLVLRGKLQRVIRTTQLAYKRGVNLDTIP